MATRTRTKLSPMSEPTVHDYTIGWICALTKEFQAAGRMLDGKYKGPETTEINDDNTYKFGHINGHNVIIGCLPAGVYGESSATNVAKDMIRSFPKLRFALMVGIGGGAPTEEHDIRLGDVVVSEPHNDHGGVVQYDRGKRMLDGKFQRTGQVNRPPLVLLGALNHMKDSHEDPDEPDKIAQHIMRMNNMPRFRRPTDDHLFCSDYHHQGGKTCANCSPERLVERSLRQTSREVEVHYGTIASGNSLMKNAKERDEFANDPDLEVMCFEMEAAGLMHTFPCLVIRGISDYCDSHKNDDWQNYAALSAAAYARELLHIVKPQKVAVVPEWGGMVAELLEDIQEEVTQASKGVGQLVHGQRDQQHLAVIEWLTSINYTAQQHQFLDMRQAGTGQWLIQSGQFKMWFQSSKQTLFCQGDPGVGKTLLTSIVVEHLQTIYRKTNSSQTHSAEDGQTGIAYIYSDFKNRDLQKPISIISSLIAQLLQHQAASLPREVEELYQVHKSIPPSSISGTSIKEFSQALIQVISSIYRQVFIVIDAIDECQNATDFLSEMFRVRNDTGANLFVTSRPEQVILGQFKGLPTLEVQATDEDLKSYITSRMSELEILSDETGELSQKFKMDLREKIQTKVTEAANGIFLLARFHMDALADKINPSGIHRELDTLPRGVHAYDQTYGKTMERIRNQKAEHRGLAKGVLLWLTLAKRSLTTTELRHALGIQEKHSAIDELDLPLTRMMVGACKGLVRVEEDTGTIRLLHYTAHEYLEGNMTCVLSLDVVTNIEAPTIFKDEENEAARVNGQRDITISCVRYLSFEVFDSGFCESDGKFEERLWSNPFFDYAAHNWGHHAREASTSCQEVIDFLECNAKVTASSQALMAVKNSYLSGYSQLVPRQQMTGLHLAAYFGLPEAVNALLGRQGLDVTDSDGRTPLCYAAQNGHGSVVKLLLDRGANIEASDTSGQTPLFCAAIHGHEAVVKLLLDRGAEVEAIASYGQTPLLWAAIHGHEAVVKLLLDKGANIEASDTSGQTPLFCAAIHGHEAVVKLLLDRGAEVEAIASYGQTPLLWAAIHGHEAVVKLLLDKGANIEASNISSQILLSLAAKREHNAMVKLLLDGGANIEASNTSS